ncbi:MAG TPA: glycosyltransferase family 2 protein [Polyangia bacterium]|nr:glycosyltransferase family 2 protein [Polyangia bacterium]
MPTEATTAQRVLVVVPTLNERDHVGAVLRGLADEKAAFRDLRVVVADGGSTDGTTAVVMEMSGRWPGVRLIHNPARIQSAAVNLAARRFGADADVLIRCDAHAAYPAAYCRRLVETLARVEADAVVVPMDSIGETCLQRAIAWVSNSPIGTGGAAHRGGRRSGFVDHGHHAAFRMAAFRRAGGYDETFTHNEDAELDCRQRSLGARVYLDADIRVGYRPRRTLRALAAQYYRYGAGRSRTARRHRGSLRARQLAVPTHLLVSALALAIAPWWRPALLWPALYLVALLASSVWFAARHRSLCGLWAGPAAAVMHLAWGSGFLLSLLRTRELRWRRELAVQLALEPAGQGAGS